MKLCKFEDNLCLCNVFKLKMKFNNLILNHIESIG